MTTRELPAPLPSELDRLRAQILAGAPDPAASTDEFQQLSSQAAREIATGKREPRVPEISFRVAGKGVTGHDLSVAVATELLGTLQGAITAVGSYVRASKKAQTPKKTNGSRLGIKEATEFRMTPTIAPGSIVFHLRGAIAGDLAEDSLFDESSDTIADVAVRELLSVLSRAQADDLNDVSALTSELRVFGAKTASKLDEIAEVALAHDLVLDLGHRSAGGVRRQAVLKSRGAQAIRAAAEANRVVDEEETLFGVLNTASDGHDRLRMTLDSGKQIRLKAEPVVGASMGALLRQRVAAEVVTTITWNLSRGREKRSYTLLSAEPAPPPTEIPA
ncbi:hypothetical protein G8C93_08635 [Cellulosimicrobium cellulans]|uniref:hypothetical protein n=1 Tax=Cellulosimicrobium cellulans TaxID=1710 RepID=UPI001883347C|nr:hypothetical protein [Cellulosimicrobium cellulans]MBE9925957.1 hypothetical protein [Cellulosimicrobium cellulans]